MPLHMVRISQLRVTYVTQEELLRKILVENGAIIAGEDHNQYVPRAVDTYVIVPHDLARNKANVARFSQTDHQVVSELWLERCMLEKSFIPPQSYPLGLFLKGPCSNGFFKLTVNATGFDALETLHISKIVALLGGKYVQIFTPAVSVLVCKGGKTNKPKLDLAQHSGIPCVSEEWLWSTIKHGRKAPVESYLIQQSTAKADGPAGKKPAPKEYVEVGTMPLRPEYRNQQSRGSNKAMRHLAEPRHETKGATNGPKAGIEVHEESQDDGAAPDENQSFNPNSAGGSAEDDDTRAGSYLPLQDNSLSNSPGRSGRTLHTKKASIQSLDGNCSMPDSKSAANTQGAAPEPGEGEDLPKMTDIRSINGAIREILEHQTKKKPKAGDVKDLSNEPGRKGRLVGRALSNLSNSSATSNTKRMSRASSVDSVNTDGIGSEVTKTHTANSTGEATSPLERASFTFTGRAQTALTGIQAHAMGVDDLDLSRGSHQAEEVPPMTQLGYEDPEEAVLLRQKLAESRRKRSKEGDSEDEPKPPAARPRMERKLRDDVLVTSAGWGAGRRTRHKQRSPQGLKEF